VIAVIDYGAGNIRSIINGLRRAGAEVKIAEEPGTLKHADAVVLPGVGAFGDAMEKLAGFKTAISDAVDSGKPLLGLCLGIQVILEESEESPGIEGLGLLRGGCRRFRGKLKVPHIGWNTVKKTRDTPLLDDIRDGEYFYFVHSYYVEPEDHGAVAAETEYMVKFPSVVADGNIFATQFHPEKSGDAGLRILKNFVIAAKR